ncbi:Acyltransferase family protein [Butyrivibrio sp. INlla18]|uniref:acyltransferase family protein n=1 Tax=Butyrivibrio sp. INlla18 TaxID=1520806 RepID=UPI00088F8A32|nr:acyltransferase family protein [Butyrivibrio sp. INlla18]SDA79196.1 Acyltransferase family protein [Butyrivibrio sp. INlla18]
MKKARKKWIDYLKTAAAYGVMLGHCYSLFIGQNPYGQAIITKTLDLFFKSTFFIYNGDMWVIVFCILTGYFASSKKAMNLREMVTDVVKRYLRFALPLSLVALFILAMGGLFGFEERSDLVANAWLGIPMTYGITDLLKMIFTFNNSVDGPLWTLRVMFISGIVMYIMNYLVNKINASKERTFFAIYTMLAVILLAAGSCSYFPFPYTSLSGCCFLGGC